MALPYQACGYRKDFGINSDNLIVWPYNATNPKIKFSLQVRRDSLPICLSGFADACGVIGMSPAERVRVSGAVQR